MPEVQLIEPMRPSRVRVDRGNGQVFEAVTCHQLFTPVLSGGEIVGRKDMIGVCVELERGHRLYCQPSQMELA